MMNFAQCETLLCSNNNTIPETVSLKPPVLPPRSKPQMQVPPFKPERDGSGSLTSSRSPSMTESLRCKARRGGTPNSFRHLDNSRSCCSSAEEPERSSRRALLSYGKIISEAESEEFSSSSSHTRPVEAGSRRQRKLRRDSRYHRAKRAPYGPDQEVLTSLQHDSIAEESSGRRSIRTNSSSKGQIKENYEVGLLRGVESKHSRVSNGTVEQGFRVGETYLEPYPNDDKYMTMLPINQQVSKLGFQRQKSSDVNTVDSESSELNDERQYVYPDQLSTQERKPTPPVHRKQYNDDGDGGDDDDNERVDRFYDLPATDCGQHM